MRLNKYIAHAGVCSRRKAADLVKAGEIQVNGSVEINPAVVVQENDVVLYQGKPLQPETKKIYLLLNKPKNTVTTLDDEKGRKTVMDLVKKKASERIYPVGRLDRMTTGLLLLTNDGDLAKKLSHPSHEVKKAYHVVLDRPVSAEDLSAIRSGLILEDGPTPIDGVDYIKGGGKNEIGIQIHIGRNRIVRRIFEHLGYKVEHLDRTYYAGLTKKDLKRGWSRFLTKQEVLMLKHFI
jgi:23S rRNA pseudouridine2605 synthase